MNLPHLNMKQTFNLLTALVLASQITACVPVVVGGAAAGGAIAADRRTSGVYIEDENIELKASKNIADALGETAHVNITSFKGNVLLTGEVPNIEAKSKAENIAKATASVRNITDELAISPKTAISSRANDTYLTSKIKAQFVTENRFQANYVKVVTENSVVYLMGYVTQAEADAAVDIARNTSGVTKVVKVFEYMQ
ncbi:osmotically-inducible protein Y precursor [mine drainage metagenome]|uniref:Osmotically-inducible protein Y n=1 Tax=mine drainage metagenome TaxID=410659 RepID=A0A1J5S8W1_9ZZZZ